MTKGCIGYSWLMLLFLMRFTDLGIWDEGLHIYIRYIGYIKEFEVTKYYVFLSTAV